MTNGVIGSTGWTGVGRMFKRPTVWGGLLLVAALAAISVEIISLPSSMTVLQGWYQGIVPSDVRLSIWRWKTGGAILPPYALALIVGIMVLERIIPVQRDQRMFTVGLAQDVTWFSIEAAFRMTILPLYITWLKMLYDAWLGFLTVPMLGTGPLAVRVACSIIVYDFLQWSHHYVRHRVGTLWYFHAVHHSQRQMSLFTDSRVHLLEPLVSFTMICLPMFILQIDPFAVASVAIAISWYVRFCHASVRTNLGALKHVLVTPQYHRIHHSIEGRHSDKNFAQLFTLWDRVFGTIYANYDEFPATGIPDTQFPMEHQRPWWAAPWGYVEQTLYPFRQMFKKVTRGIA